MILESVHTILQGSLGRTWASAFGRQDSDTGLKTETSPGSMTHRPKSCEQNQTRALHLITRTLWSVESEQVTAKPARSVGHTHHAQHQRYRAVTSNGRQKPSIHNQRRR